MAAAGKNDTAFWEGLWTRDGGLQPGTAFDREVPSPALVDAVGRGAVLPDRLGKEADLTALVPGCGRGYDVVYLGKSGHFGAVTGLDVAPSGAAAATAYLASQGVPEGVTVACADFFQFDGVPGGYDLIYVRFDRHLDGGGGGKGEHVVPCPRPT